MLTAAIITLTTLPTTLTTLSTTYTTFNTNYTNYNTKTTILTTLDPRRRSYALINVTRVIAMQVHDG